MSTKLLAIGNVLMGDDGIAIFLAAALEERLNELGVEVIFGETDIGYSISKIRDGDLIFIMDAAVQGKATGEVSLYGMEDISDNSKKIIWHDISLVDLLELYYPNNYCYIITIEAAGVDFHYGPSPQLEEIIPAMTQEVYSKIKTALKLS
jgi:hydrogenase maturation protease